MKRAMALLLLVSAAGFGGLFLVFGHREAPPPDTVALNDAVMIAFQSGDRSEAARILTDDLARAYGEMDAARRSQNGRTLLALCALFGGFAAACAGLMAYCERRVLLPFRKLRRFAQNIAAGNFDIPLEMDRHGGFGAFTESFDLMREELYRARENERQASQSKKELVASLSHDIKTPVASIKAVAELMMAKSPQSAGQLGVILAKADQIDLLITNMFHAALEEMAQLQVVQEEAPSTLLYELLQCADYDRKIRPFTIPECIVKMDRSRLQQVFDNIVSNSYKYAGTGITVTARYEGRFLAVEVRDTGPGVAPDELPLLFEKFHRGGNAAGKSGAGLGLYIAKHLMNKMDGDIVCQQDEGGFAIKILLAM